MGFWQDFFQSPTPYIGGLFIAVSLYICYRGACDCYRKRERRRQNPKINRKRSSKRHDVELDSVTIFEEYGNPHEENASGAEEYSNQQEGGDSGGLLAPTLTMNEQTAGINQRSPESAEVPVICTEAPSARILCTISDILPEDPTPFMAKDIPILDGARNFQQATSNNRQFTVVKFYTSWCGSCKQIAPHYNKIAADLSGDGFLFYCLDVDNNKDIAKQHSIEMLPTFIVYRGGQIVYRQTGTIHDKLRRGLTDLVTKN
ncbi:hypothetical protein BV898_03368 [Hypsibius exemplaris]|uniref:Thioredoxin domain-containing protein n=1 Tax=Hypsibius exemplaris TaxID=2072580 RepID=A0A1W0X5E4_HYPEX|nr:hypothetical protein BV898_03368 [Hypsibius exemplaris]